MTFKANKNGTWVGGDDQSQGTVVYGKSGDNWLYAKSVWANNNGTWTRAWTDCRRHDSVGGRDWLPTTLPAVYSGSCGNQTYQIPTRYTKDGCPSYDVAGSTVAAPDCNSSCYNSPTVTEEYFDGSCTTRRFRTKTVTNPKSGSGCSSTTSYGSPYASPTCEGGCTTVYTAVEYNYNGKMLYSFAEDGYYAAFFDNCAGCGGGAGCTSSSYYYLTVCGGTVTVNFLYCDACSNIFDNTPC
jgi:hypothetical protein